MNEPTEHKRMTSLDAKIANAKRRADAERQAAVPAQPMHGLTYPTNPTPSDSTMAKKDRPTPFDALGRAAQRLVEAAETDGMPARVRAAVAQGDANFAAALSLMRTTIVAEPDLVSAWHKFLARSFFDAACAGSKVDSPSETVMRAWRTAANRGAADFMAKVFGVDTLTQSMADAVAKFAEPRTAMSAADAIQVWYEEAGGVPVRAWSQLTQKR